jgi:hypothetical protein
MCSLVKLFAESHLSFLGYLFVIVLSVIMLSVIRLSVIMLSVIRLSVIVLSVIRLSVARLIVLAPMPMPEKNSAEARTNSTNDFTSRVVPYLS